MILALSLFNINSIYIIIDIMHNVDIIMHMCDCML